MMETMFTGETVFHLWWVLINGIFYFAEADFLLRFWESRNKQFFSVYVTTNILLTVLAIFLKQFFIMGLFHILLLFLFLKGFLKVPFRSAITPTVIIFTLSTFREGFVTVLMEYLSSNLKSQEWGAFFQFALPALLAGLFFVTLRLIVKRYPLMNHFFRSSYLYRLLLPCTFLILGMRISLGLDQRDMGLGSLIGSTPTGAVLAMFWMMGALFTFFVILESFHKIAILSRQETEHALLGSAMKEQSSYIAEARQRNEEYRSFQHDINNHLLVLSGLLRAQLYPEAKSYLEKLNVASNSLSEQISTGNSVLDILLWEKVRYAKQFQITITCDIQIPKENIVADIDLCILFANGIDNAIKACRDGKVTQRTITVTTKPKHSFLLIHMVNEVEAPKPLIYGTGLRNIELTAKKYGGTIHIEQTAQQFSLSILLCYKKDGTEEQ